MAPGDVCHGLRSTLAGLGAGGLEYHPFCWPVAFGWVAPVRPTLGVWFAVPCHSAAVAAYAYALSMALWRSVTGARAHRIVVLVFCVCGVHSPLAVFHRRVVCAVSSNLWRLFTVLRAWCFVCTMSLACSRWCTGACAQCFECWVFLASSCLFSAVLAAGFVCAASLALWC